MDRVVLETIAVCLLFAAIFGPLAARSSIRREPIYGGWAARIFHFLGAALMMGVVPGVLAALILGGGFGVAFPVAFSFLGLSFLALLLFAAFEKPSRAAALAQTEDQGWTERDARTSGL